VVLRGAGLAGDRPADRGGPACAARDDALEHRGRQVRHVGLDHLAADRLVLVELAAAGLEHARDRERLAVHAVVRQRRVPRRHVERRDLLDAQRDRRDSVQLRGDPHPVRDLDDPLRSHVEGELREHDVDGVLRGGPQVHVAAIPGALGVMHAVVVRAAPQR
jgi:hypothetical protein